ncbi:hypothetical protein [Natroniella sp. ANB-PHB2]|uniref:hypothetical protein n=1 Tax=Natroniella sp. ANB-PHB2 TaxID=3384444 RepID=UPI0038D4F1BD
MKRISILIILFMVISSSFVQAEEINGSSMSLFDYLYLIGFFVNIPFVIHAQTSSLKKREQFLWTLILFSFSILGLILYYFKIIRKRN